MTDAQPDTAPAVQPPVEPSEPSIHRTGRRGERSAAGPTPLYAVAGAGDLAVATVRTALPVLLAVPSRAQAYVVGVGTSAAERAVTTYDGLAARGRDLVERIEQQPSTRELQAQARLSARRAKAVVTTTRRSAGKVGKATARAADAAGTTAQTAASVVEEGVTQVGEGGPDVPGRARE